MAYILPRGFIYWTHVERICVLGVSIWRISTIFLLAFENVPTVWYILFAILFYQYVDSENTNIRYLIYLFSALP